MQINIIITNYLLKYMYGNQTFQDPILLSREVLKKAYQEGLYYIAKKEIIEGIYANKKFPTTSGFFFAGIPSVEEISLTSFIETTLYAIKLNLAYELLADFTYQTYCGEQVLSDNLLNLEDIDLEKKCLTLQVLDKKPIYQESETPHYYIDKEKESLLKQYFTSHVKEYYFIINKKLKLLNDKLIAFMNSKQAQKWLDDKQNLAILKACYEDIIYKSVL